MYPALPETSPSSPWDCVKISGRCRRREQRRGQPPRKSFRRWRCEDRISFLFVFRIRFFQCFFFLFPFQLLEGLVFFAPGGHLIPVPDDVYLLPASSFFKHLFG